MKGEKKGKTPKNSYHKNANLWNNKQRDLELQKTKSLTTWKRTKK